MKRGGCKFGGSKTGAVVCPKRGAVVSQLVPKLKESVPPPPTGGGGGWGEEGRKVGYEGNRGIYQGARKLVMRKCGRTAMGNM